MIPSKIFYQNKDKREILSLKKMRERERERDLASCNGAVSDLIQFYNLKTQFGHSACRDSKANVAICSQIPVSTQAKGDYYMNMCGRLRDK